MQIGRYTVLSTLGEGGMSEALLAQAPDGTHVVIKKPKVQHGKGPDPDVCTRMRDEGRLGMRLRHESLVETLDFFELDGMPIIVVAYVSGTSIEDMRTRGALPGAAVARVGAQVADALAVLHNCFDASGRPLVILHRDVTGNNVLVDREARARLIDLGIARHDDGRSARTQAGMLIGTIRYMAPEVLNEQSYSPASDLWALGCVLFEAATGEPVFSGSPGQIAASVMMHDPFARPEAHKIAPALTATLALLLEKNPARRLYDAREAAERLRAVEPRLGDGRLELLQRIANVPTAAMQANSPGWATPAESTEAWDSARLAASPPQSPFAGAPSASGNAFALPPGPPDTALMSGPPAMTGAAPAPVTALAMPAPMAGPPPSAMLQVNLSAPAPSARTYLDGSAATNVGFAPPVAITPSGKVASSPRPPPSVDLFRPPPPPPSLDLDLDRAKPPPRQSTLANQAQWYPKKQRDWAGVQQFLSNALWILVGVVVLGGGYWFLAHDADAEEAAAAAAAAANVDTELLRRSNQRDAPECWTGQEGQYLAYTNDKGSDVVVSSPKDIPSRFRKQARCVSLSK